MSQRKERQSLSSMTGGPFHGSGPALSPASWLQSPAATRQCCDHKQGCFQPPKCCGRQSQQQARGCTELTPALPPSKEVKQTLNGPDADVGWVCCFFFFFPFNSTPTGPETTGSSWEMKRF